MNTNQWQQKTAIPADVPDEYKAHALEDARRKFSQQIFDILFTQTKQAWNVVKISEEIRQREISIYANPLFRIDEEILHTLEYKPVQYRDVVIQEFAPVPYIKPLTFIDRLRYLITGKTP